MITETSPIVMSPSAKRLTISANMKPHSPKQDGERS